MEESTVLRVSANSTPASVAGMIANEVKEKGECVLQAVGAGAVNQTVKAIATARGYVASYGYELYCIPAFTEVKIAAEDRTAMKFICRYK